MFYIFANLAQLERHACSTRHATSHSLNHSWACQLLLRERIFCKLSNAWEELDPPFVACRCGPSLRTSTGIIELCCSPMPHIFPFLKVCLFSWNFTRCRSIRVCTASVWAFMFHLREDHFSMFIPKWKVDNSSPIQK